MKNRKLWFIPLVLAMLILGIMFTGSTGKWMTLGPSVAHATAPVCDQTPWTLSNSYGWGGQAASVTLPAPANGCNRHIITFISASVLNNGDTFIPTIQAQDGSTVVWRDDLYTNFTTHPVEHLVIPFPVTPDSGAYGQYGWTGLRVSGALTVKFLSFDSNAYQAINVQGFDIPCNGNAGGFPGAC